MCMHPDLLSHVAKDHQLQLSREAEVDRQARLARVDSPSLSMRMRQRVSALLSRMGRLVQPRSVARAEARRA